MSNEPKEEFKFRLSSKTLVIIDWANVYGWFSRPKSKTYLGWEVCPERLFNYLSTYSEIIDKRLYNGVEIGDERSEVFGAKVGSLGFNFIKKEVKWVPVYLNEQTHFKKIVRELFNTLDGVKITNSDIATKLYELKGKIKSQQDQKVYELIDESDTELKKLNFKIEELQQHLLEPVERRKCDFDVEIARDAFNLSKDFECLILFSGDGDYSALVEDLIVEKGKKVIVVFAPGHIGREYDKLTEFLTEKGLKYRLFLCTANKLRNEISLETNIPPDFSGGRDVSNIPESKLIINEKVDN